ncbi:hypothetical protein Tco_1514185 [Tanacetum coccineum]
MLSLMRIDSLQSIDQVSGFQMELETLGLVVPEEVTREVVQHPKPELRKRKKNRTPKNFGLEFQLYLIEGTRDEKEAVNDEMDSIMGNNTWVLADLPGFKLPGYKWIFKRKLQYHVTVDCFVIYSQSYYSSYGCENNFLNGELDEEAPKKWHQKFDEVVLSSGYLLTKLTNVYIENLMKLDMGEVDVILVSTPMDTSEKLRPNNGQAVS